MICPSTQVDCDNPGCRRGGCQGRLPQLPLFQVIEMKRDGSPQPVAELRKTQADPRPLAA